MTELLATNAAALSDACKLLDAMANATRLQIFSLLAKGEMSVTVMSKRLHINQASLSQHLKVLRTAGFVSTRRDAQMIYYSCQSPAVLTLLNTLQTFDTAQDTDALAA